MFIFFMVFGWGFLIDAEYTSTSFCESTGERINSLPNDKILDWSKLKAFADDTIKVTKNLKFVLGWIENIVVKGENAGNQHFLLFPECF